MNPVDEVFCTWMRRCVQERWKILQGHIHPIMYELERFVWDSETVLFLRDTPPAKNTGARTGLIGFISLQRGRQAYLLQETDFVLPLLFVSVTVLLPVAIISTLFLRWPLLYVILTILLFYISLLYRFLSILFLLELPLPSLRDTFEC